MKRAKSQVIRAVRVGFMSLCMDDHLLSEVQVIIKNREQTKNIRWDYIGKYTSEKRKESLKYWWKKRKKKKWKIPNPAYWERLNQSTQTSLRRNFYWSFSPSNEQSSNFYSNQGLDFQYQKENDQECTVKNPALKSLGRWNEEGMRREWEVANNRAKVAFLVMEPPR